MHDASMNIMKKFVDTYLDVNDTLNILDVGSKYINGSYKELFDKNSKWQYKGLDIVEGKNVDIVVEHPYDWIEVESNSYDVVISGQCLEHVEAPWLWIKEVERVCKDLVCIIAPWSCHIHGYPVDCWRILPDGILYLMTRWCNFKTLDYGSNDEKFVKDCWFMGRK